MQMLCLLDIDLNATREWLHLFPMILGCFVL